MSEVDLKGPIGPVDRSTGLPATAIWLGGLKWLSDAKVTLQVTSGSGIRLELTHIATGWVVTGDETMWIE